MAAAPAATAASATLTEPNTLVLTPSPQSRSSSGTCLSAAAWNTMSGLKSANRRKMRSRSRTSASRPSICARRLLGGQRLQHRVQRRLGILDHQQPRRAEGDDAIADFRADRAAAAGDDDRLALHEILEPPVVDLHARPQQQVLDATGASRSASPPSSSDGSRLVARPSRRACIRIVSGLASGSNADGVSTTRATSVSALAQDRRPRARDRRSRRAPGRRGSTGPDRTRDGDRMPTGQIFLTAPLSIARSSTSASAARPRIRVGAASAISRVLPRARVAEIAIGDARPAQEEHLQDPVEQRS